MPRRPRPTSRRPPQNAIISPVKAKLAPPVSRGKSTSNPKLATKPLSEEAESEESSADLDLDSEEGYPSGAGRSRSGDEEDYLREDSLGAGHEEAEPDVPRAAQWVDDEGLSEVSRGESEISKDEEAQKFCLQAGLQSLSFGALRKAQKALIQVSTISASEEEGPSDMSEPEEGSQPRLDKSKEKEVPSRQKKEVPKRKNKHAPMEMSSKRPVSRSRFISEEKPVPRDPRFLQVTGDFDAKRFRNQYGFLSDLHQDELSTLKDNLKRARKLLANSPRDLREEREGGVERLERAIKRAESLVNKDRRERVEMEALRKVAEDEREKRRQGKKAWYMKDADKKSLLLRAKYDALAEIGGKGAVRKAMEKKQKKVNQKEKKRRPFAPGQPSGSRSGADEGPARMKRPHSGGEGGSRKRPRPS
ncbi:hypothetical protein GSI_06598 [Ganoderma sinense ZZ0214-1]|uniref:rRNA biogenesis protein RRP36 n=1 Tax=Ganoderma sinense ZZ0214-1 TaxID=1077348 RepID=A0A2G8SDP1_9APHY|nr:hypothetical protein GSI_06598 [Ganoderma sinense ZZ0214-1]